MTSKLRSLVLLALPISAALAWSACSRSVQLGEQALGSVGQPPKTGGSCDTGLTPCAGVCRDLTADPLRCGTCDTACATGKICSASACTGGATDCPDPSAPDVRYVSHDPLACAASLFQCDPGQEPFGSDACGCGCIGAPRQVTTGGCFRTDGTTCSVDTDCKGLGCGGELCANPAQSSGITTCDCVAPTTAACGCVNGLCAWWK